MLKPQLYNRTWGDDWQREKRKPNQTATVVQAGN